MIIDFSKYIKVPYHYDGLSSEKQCIIYDNYRYMIKFPFILNCNFIKNDHYIAFREHVGSKIYEILEIPVHKTIIGKYNKYLVVACKHIHSSNEEFINFSKIKSTYVDNNSEISTQTKNCDLKNTLEIISKHPLLLSAGGAIVRFWDMFVVDLLIDNFDRNNSNWGIIANKKNYRLAPVFDNESCFSSLVDINAKENNRYKPEHNILYNNRYITPYEIIQQCCIYDCNAAISRIRNRYNSKKIEEIFYILEYDKIITKKITNILLTIIEKNFEKYFFI